MNWYTFRDNYSGGNLKTPYRLITIEAEDESGAAEIFEAIFSQSPYEEECACCGVNFDVLTDGTRALKCAREGVTLLEGAQCLTVDFTGLGTITVSKPYSIAEETRAILQSLLVEGRITT